jgi:AraC-like DNA-binding protein
MAVTVGQVEFSDFEALQDTVALDSHSDIVQIGRGRMAGAVTHMALGSTFGVATGSFSRGIRARGVMSEQRWMLGLLLGTVDIVTLSNFNVTPGAIVVIKPGHERYGSLRGATCFAGHFIAPEELYAFLAPQPAANDALLQLHGVSMLAVDPATAVANVRQLSLLLNALRELGTAMPDDTVEFYKRNILELLTAPMRDASDDQGARPLSVVALVRDIDCYLGEAGNRPVHRSELCEKFKVSRRSLHRAFNDVLGIPPITFLRRKRLGDVHTALLRREHVHVRDMAIEHGFLEQGKFASEYRGLFGEKPSETLHRGRDRAPR